MTYTDTYFVRRLSPDAEVATLTQVCPDGTTDTEQYDEWKWADVIKWVSRIQRRGMNNG